MKRILFFCLILVSPFVSSSAYCARPVNGDKRTVRHQQQAACEHVRNIIYMIGDGMGLAHVSMLKIENGYKPTAFDRATNIALISTYSANNRVTDSAAAGTAIATGYKTNNRMIGMTPDSAIVESMIAKAVGKGHPAGIVVTCALQHATPAAFYAHASNRKDEAVISSWLIDSGLDVAFGGGRKSLETETSDGMTYMDALRDAGYNIIEDVDDIDSATGPVIGIFADEHLESMQNGRGGYLPRAVDRALDILSEDAEYDKTGGFILMVEGSQIDMEAHENDAAGVLAEIEDFDAAVTCAFNFADRHAGTLVVVTADHETGGLSIPSGNSDFSRSESGIEYKFGTKGHSGTLVPVYLYGTGAECINGIMDNTRLARRLMELMGVE